LFFKECAELHGYCDNPTQFLQLEINLALWENRDKVAGRATNPKKAREAMKTAQRIAAILLKAAPFN